MRSSSPRPPPLSPGVVLPRAIGASSGPGGDDGASHKDGDHSEVAADGGKLEAAHVFAKGRDEIEDRNTRGTPPVEEPAALNEIPLDVPDGAVGSGADDEYDDNCGTTPPSSPPEAAAVSLPRPTNPNDLVRLFLAESGSGSGGGGPAAASGSAPSDGYDSVGKDASAGAPPTATASVAEESGVDALNEYGPLDEDARQEGVGLRVEQEEEGGVGRREGGNTYWAAASPVDSGVSGADSGFGRGENNNCDICMLKRWMGGECSLVRNQQSLLTRL